MLCSMWDLSSPAVAAAAAAAKSPQSCPTLCDPKMAGDQICAPLCWKHGVLITELPGKSISSYFNLC